ncbi:hypothetical protein [Tenggerimyces flavus]|uniref:Uncharacterized protein n=1 Tax=Tenggerimyces flavus TaxID=1708749 RepID=A0ABV7Y977_9ACTN|nr:hypothetical protein [Tenggerimyces flavus]MBM7783669.1 hypothetical protein [Tenggerimyces flavus]
MTGCSWCRSGVLLGFLRLPGVWTNAVGAELRVVDEVPLCADCVWHWGDQPRRPDAVALAGELEAWRRGEL